jgi:hypothetical protein
MKQAVDANNVFIFPTPEEVFFLSTFAIFLFVRYWRSFHSPLSRRRCRLAKVVFKKGGKIFSSSVEFL